jgi:hypothetical protein
LPLPFSLFSVQRWEVVDPYWQDIIEFDLIDMESALWCRIFHASSE